MSEHTPGPWKCSVPKKTVSNYNVWVADVDSKELLVAADVRGIGMAECEANARLIAAAPELLKLVRRAFDRFTDNDMQPANHQLQLWLNEAQAALDKAEGQP